MLEKVICRLCLLCLLLGLPFSLAEARDQRQPARPFLGPDYTLGLDVWYLNTNGHMQLDGGEKVLVPEDVELGEGTNTFPLYIQIERIGPFFPNFRLHTYRYSYESRLKNTENTRFGGVTYSPGSRVSLDVFAIGLIAYYLARPFETEAVEAEYGFEVRRFGGEIGMAGEDANIRAPSEVKYDITGEVIGYLPLLHLGLAYRLPNPKLRFSLEGEGLKLGDYAYYDGRLLVEYQLFGLVFGAGYRNTYFGGKIEVDDSDVGIHGKGSFFRVSFTL